MGMAFKTSMPPVRKFVLVAMCDMANDAEQGLTYPSIATIARHCSVDRRTVERAIGLSPDSVTIYQMEIPHNTTVAGVPARVLRYR